jgi:viroplasmin and RNaseH domain-containing protein
MTWYVVSCGRQTGVFATWEGCHAQVNGFKGACYKGYKTKAEAFEAYHKKHSCDLVINTDEPQDCKEIKQKTEFTSCKDIIIIVLLAIVLAQFICILVFLNNRV